MAAADYGYLWEGEWHMERARGKCTTIKIGWTDAFRAGEHAFFREKRVQARAYRFKYFINGRATVINTLLLLYLLTCIFAWLSAAISSNRCDLHPPRSCSTRDTERHAILITQTLLASWSLQLNRPYLLIHNVATASSSQPDRVPFPLPTVCRCCAIAPHHFYFPSLSISFLRRSLVLAPPSISPLLPVQHIVLYVVPPPKGLGGQTS